MLKRWCVLVFISLPILASAQNRSAHIQGTVIDRVTSKGIEGASVLLTGVVDNRVVNLTTKTSAGGRFVFPKVAQSTGYWLIASHGEKHLMTVYQQRGLSLIGKPIPVSPGEQILDLRIEMMPTGEISGRVVNAGGKPVSDATVVPMARRYLEGVPVLSPVKPYVRTNGRGEYQLSGLPPGPLYLRVTAGRLSHRDLLDSQNPLLGPPLMELAGYPITYFPGTMDHLQARTIYLRGGEHRREVDIVMSQVSTRRIRGLMVDGRTGMPIRSAQLLVVERGALPSRPPYRAVEIKNGRFDLRGVRPGSYYLLAATIAGQSRLSGRIVLDVDSENRDGLVLPLMPDLEISGGILDRRAPDLQRKDLSRVTVTLKPEPPASVGPANTSVVFRDFRDTLSFPPIMATSANGLLAFRGIQRWQYSVEVSHPFEDSYVESVRLGSIDVMTDGLTVEQALADPLEIVLAAPAARIEGQVFDRTEKPAGALRVVLIPEQREHRRLYRHVWTDEDGRFQMKNLPPGNYELFAWEFVENEMWLDSDFLRLYEGKGIAIRLEEGSRSAVTLHPIPRWY